MPTDSTIHNPVLPGFHPDPSICRVGEDYYIATSTFEWWPGVRIHHSRDLVNWRHCSYAVTRRSQLDLIGHPDSAGVWAPCLSHAHGRFWLIYSDVRSMFGAHKDVHNYLITATDIDGPWSERIYLNSSGFDPSLFHDDGGRSWFLNQRWCHLPGHNPFDGILLQEFDRTTNRLVGPVKNIYAGTSLGVVEGAHLYRRGGWYYLFTAEGGTFYEHAVTVARSRQIDGPYETLPDNPLLTAQHTTPAGLQRSGHSSLVQTPQGQWYLAYLCGRPIEWAAAGTAPAAAPERYAGLHCILGRETALQRLHWREDGWPEIDGGQQAPQYTTPAPSGVTVGVAAAQSQHDDFDMPELAPEFNSLRVPFDESWLSLRERPGHLRLKGRESLTSLFEQSLIARRQQHFHCRVQTQVEFAAQHHQQMAGLVAYYNSCNHAYLHVTANTSTGERELRLALSHHGVLSEPCAPVALRDGPVRLRVDFRLTTYQFSYADGDDAVGDWHTVGPALSSAMLSDEAVTHFDGGFARSFGFTGNFIGVACQDLAGTRLYADFDHFSYEALSAS